VGRPQVVTAPELVAGVPVGYAGRKRRERLDAFAHGDAGRVRYLLFGAHWDAKGGTSDRVGVFSSEGRARAAFIELRLKRSDRVGWAALAKLDEHGELTPLAWFGVAGIDRPAGDTTPDLHVPWRARVGSGRWRFRRGGRPPGE